METNIVPLKKQSFKSKGYNLQCTMRSTPLKKWLETPELAERLSGTLRKNARIGFRHHSQLAHEAICQTLGWGFEIAKSSYITFNDAITEGDCHAVTEAGWHIDRLLSTHIFDEDYFELKYINIQNEDSEIIKQGVGLILRETSVQWIGSGNICFAILAEYEPKKGWKECINPF